MRKLQKFTIPVLIGIFLLILAACGGDDDSTELKTTGEAFELQYVCVNRTLLPCKVIQEFMDAVSAKTDGQVDIQLTSYPELGISGFDMIRLLEDGTIGMGEIYSGSLAVSSRYSRLPIFGAPTRLWTSGLKPPKHCKKILKR